MTDGATLRVTVVYSPEPRLVLEWPVELPQGATLRQAVLASGLPDACPQLALESMQPGIWGRKAAWDQRLRDGDRAEVYRDLKVDPKYARRERFRKQGVRAAGLFARQRPGGKPGY
jgi:putative ubiquitin-RnfH superfamily antitoxin RatB of RatAB toxin-antitoxin module